jgi:mono/diheme cytochrome c family protein
MDGRKKTECIITGKISVQVNNKNQANVMNRIVLISGIFSGIFLLTSFKRDPQLEESIKRGNEVYAQFCQNCHMEDGLGVPGINPPVAQADYVKKPANLLITGILKGQSGEMSVNGVQFNGSMPAQEYLTDVQIADVLNYVRNSWGNKVKGVVTPAMVKTLRN